MNSSPINIHSNLKMPIDASVKDSNQQKIISCISVIIALASIALIVVAYSCFSSVPMEMVIGGCTGFGVALIALSICGILRHRNSIIKPISQQEQNSSSSSNVSVVQPFTTPTSPSVPEPLTPALEKRNADLMSEETDRNLIVAKVEHELDAFKQTDTYRNLPLAEVRNESGLPSPNDDVRKLLTHYNQQREVLGNLLKQHANPMTAWNQPTVVDQAVQLVKIAYWVSTETMKDIKNVSARHQVNSQEEWQKYTRSLTGYDLNNPKALESAYILDEKGPFHSLFYCVRRAYSYLENRVPSVSLRITAVRSQSMDADREYRNYFFTSQSKPWEARMLKNAFYCLVWTHYREEFYTGKLATMQNHQAFGKAQEPDLR